MEIYPHLLARMILASFVVGAVLGGVYDLIRIFRIIRACGECPQDVSPVRLPQRVRAFIGRDVFPLGHRKKGRVGRALSFIALLVEDLIFFALVGCAIAVLIYCSNDGVFRILIPFGVAVGFFTYYFTAGRLVIGTARPIARAVCIAVTYGAILFRLPVLVMIGSIKKRTRKRKKQGENNNVI